MAIIKCSECGKDFSDQADKCPNCGNPNKVVAKTENVNVIINEKPKGKWSTIKLIIGIISMVLFLLISVQSCAVGVSNAIADSKATSGSAGFGCGFLILIGGIVTVATRNSKGKGGAIAAIILYWLAALLTLNTGDTYGDLPIWGSIAFSFGLINLGGILANTKTFSEGKKPKLLIALVIVVSIIALIIGFSSGSSTNENKNDSTEPKTNNTDKTKDAQKDAKKNYGLGDTFKFDDLEITIGKEISFATIKNQFSEHNKKSAIKIPVTVKNLKDETHSLNMFYFKAFGSQGTQAESVSSYFDDSIDWAGELRSGASYTKYFYILYDGDGKYSIEFDDWSDKIILEFDVKK